MAPNASTIVTEIVNNVFALSSVLDNSQNPASTSTTPNTTVEEEVRRLFRPGSVRKNSNVIYQHENLCENGMNQLTSVQRQIYDVQYRPKLYGRFVQLYFEYTCKFAFQRSTFNPCS